MQLFINPENINRHLKLLHDVNSWSQENESASVIRPFAKDWSGERGQGARAGSPERCEAGIPCLVLTPHRRQRAEVSQTLQPGGIRQPSSPALLELTTGR